MIYEIRCPRCDETYIAIDDSGLLGPAVVSTGFIRDEKSTDYICLNCRFRVSEYSVWEATGQNDKMLL